MTDFDRSFARAQYAYDSMLPPEPCCDEDDTCDCDEQRELAEEAAAEARAEQAWEDALYDDDREDW